MKAPDAYPTLWPALGSADRRLLDAMFDRGTWVTAYECAGGASVAQHDAARIVARAQIMGLVDTQQRLALPDLYRISDAGSAARAIRVEQDQRPDPAAATLHLVRELAADFASVQTMTPMGPTLMCAEAESMARMLSLLGFNDAAVALMESHASSDEQGDAHYGLVIR